MEIIISVIGGLGLLLYGMSLMGEALQKAVGNKMRDIIGALTKNKYMGALVGCVVTILVGSSSATTVMTIGFVNAGVMTLDQAVGIIIGSNLGTTVTAQLIALNLDAIAPLVAGIGVFVILLSKSKKRMRSIGEIMFGFGLIFLGMSMMKSGLEPLQNEPWFTEFFYKLDNPFVGLLVGLGLTTLVQSSAASIGLMQALAAEGFLTINQAFPVLFGDNIGTTTTGLISSIGTNRNGKRTAFMHFMFNVVGTILFMTLLRIPIQRVVIYLSPDNPARQIANAHTLFNLVNIFIQLPFSSFLVKAARFFVPGGETDERSYSTYLDDRVLRTPSIALDAARKEIERMADLALSNIERAELSISTGSEVEIESVAEYEETINHLEEEIVEYLVKLGRENLSEDQYSDLNTMMSMTTDLERVGDHATNLAELAHYMNEERIQFSEDALGDAQAIIEKAIAALDNAMDAFKHDDMHRARAVFAIEDEVDAMEKKFRREHMDRLADGSCMPPVGVVFLDVLTNIERVSDHANNIATYLIENEAERKITYKIR